MEYSVYNWYWLVEGKIWSSKFGYVDNCDDFIAAGGVPTRIASLAELRDVLKQQAPDLIGIMSPDEFFDQFAFSQWAAIKEAAKTDPQIEYLMDRLRVVKTVDPGSPTTIQGVNYLVSQGLISQDDLDRILNRGVAL